MGKLGRIAELSHLRGLKMITGFGLPSPGGRWYSKNHGHQNKATLHNSECIRVSLWIQSVGLLPPRDDPLPTCTVSWLQAHLGRCPSPEMTETYPKQRLANDSPPAKPGLLPGFVNIHWHTATRVCSRIGYGCLCSTMTERSSFKKDYLAICGKGLQTWRLKAI